MLYQRTIHAILRLLYKVELFINLQKCIFIFNKVYFFSFIIRTHSIYTNLAQVNTITKQLQLTNTPISFQAYINKALIKYLDYIYIVYLDNILIYTSSINIILYQYTIYTILRLLYKIELFINLQKYIFISNKVYFLSFIIRIYSIYTNLAQVNTITKQLQLTNIKKL